MFTNYTITRKCWRGIEIEIRWEASAITYDDGRVLGHLEIEAIAAYRRGDLFEKRRALMEAWAGFAGAP